VQPYWLQATTSKAPWIPTTSAYNGNLPWCITWAVNDFSYVGGGRTGLATPPASASGTILHGRSGVRDPYRLTGGRLAWLNADGTETPIPLTADQFVPSRGASISLNGRVLSANGSNGTWSRRTAMNMEDDPYPVGPAATNGGDVWHFSTRADAKTGPFTLDLNFADKTWSFRASPRGLERQIKAADGKVRVQVVVQKTYGFTTWLKHDVDVTWHHQESRSAWQPSGVHEIRGAYNSRTGTGHVVLEGHVPRDLREYGDVEVRVNGTSVDIPLLAKKFFLNTLKWKGIVRHATDGLSYKMDFGVGRWRLRIDGDRFKKEMAP